MTRRSSVLYHARTRCNAQIIYCSRPPIPAARRRALSPRARARAGDSDARPSGDCSSCSSTHRAPAGPGAGPSAGPGRLGRSLTEPRVQHSGLPGPGTAGWARVSDCQWSHSGWQNLSDFELAWAACGSLSLPVAWRQVRGGTASLTARASEDRPSSPGGHWHSLGLTRSLSES